MSHHNSVSYWQSNTQILPLSTNLPRTVDVAVIGGGLLGVATSYWLARAGIQVALLEHHFPAYGATGRNGGFVRAGSAISYPDTIDQFGQETARAVMTLTSQSKVLTRQVVEEERIACEYREPGSLRLALNKQEVEQFKDEVILLQADGFSAQFLNQEQTQALIKTPIAAEIIGGRFLPGQGLVHSARLVQGLVEAALRYSARVYQTEVREFVQQGNGILLHTTSGDISAGAVVVATNAWTGQLLPSLSDIIMPEREQMLAYAPLPPIFSTGVTADCVTGEYWQQTPDGTILIGGCSSVAPNGDLGVWETQPTIVVQKAIEQILPRLFPSLAPLQVIQRWAGTLGCTTDMHPIVDRVPEISHAYFVGGFTGHGMPFGMRFGQLLAETVMSEIMPIELKPYRLDRPTLRPWSTV
ncbi:MAG: FAD-binding oxidoreductase [Ktedonobacteraceae bacterium]|nr:FAD-binding oxidoreductase [Ktedonobacteraceae bacterium]